ncbi:heterocyst-inhibiting protein PatX [Microcoleus sp. FACHB-672]|uniref:heterocyst-inhibiting protein PatX n=1 Tax=Microcoleus sp. FACHB-672 TaxID=2692825 RepID=UPI001686F226|nr:hypothetical protein [Microcoleus sp. FACHB-672]MBD2040276.1 hypothetical protein [Microcoleus sp. FACHB-672]
MRTCAFIVLSSLLLVGFVVDSLGIGSDSTELLQATSFRHATQAENEEEISPHRGSGRVGG